MKRVLVTGACGNIGALTVELLQARGYEVRALDLGLPAQRELAAGWGERVSPYWGDICDRALLERAALGVDHVLHLAAIIPPVTDVDQLLGYRVNVVGTDTLVSVCEAQPAPPRFVFCSSAAVFGNNAQAIGPRRADEPVVASDNYTRQKLQCEHRITASTLPYVIFRLGLTPPLTPSSLSPFVFDFHPDTRVEFTHPRDLALGLCNALLVDDVLGRVMMLGGGADNRYTYEAWLNEALAALGIGPMPRSAFGEHRFYTDWVDSETSQALLDYQRHSYADYLDEIRAALGPVKHVVGLVAPLATRYALANSRHHAASEGVPPRLPDALRTLEVVRRGLRGASAYFESGA